MTPVQFAIARAAKQMQDEDMLKYAEQFDRAKPLVIPSVRQIVSKSAGEPVSPPRRTRERFTFSDYVKRYGCFSPKPKFIQEQQERAMIESDWERRMFAEAEEEAARNRTRRLSGTVNSGSPTVPGTGSEET